MACAFRKIEAIIQALRDGTFQWHPVRRVYIPKKQGKLRPLGLPDWSSKLVQEVIRMLLEAYYEPQVRHDRRYSIPN
jgi:retron-type reverse transcriptase